MLYKTFYKLGFLTTALAAANSGQAGERFSLGRIEVTAEQTLPAQGAETVTAETGTWHLPEQLRTAQ